MDTPPDPSRSEWDALADAMQRLLERHERVCEQNQSLLASQQQLTGERAGLLARNEQARSRVEAMIQRLKSLESAG